ncbi:B130 [miniopterid betaherpesvirus 1]|uniref:B130 n=1 Tax=miniopterid betaherpesvirus 1 TaxID=3070189 RepID=I3VQC7_9BETA|nr:B130 [miniopterid betaherpesvirus 1]AFK83971.1 B130 [miniopterid betaherpesvirus 1]
MRTLLAHGLLCYFAVVCCSDIGTEGLPDACYYPSPPRDFQYFIGYYRKIRPEECPMHNVTVLITVFGHRLHVNDKNAWVRGVRKRLE